MGERPFSRIGVATTLTQCVEFRNAVLLNQLRDERVSLPARDNDESARQPACGCGELSDARHEAEELCAAQNQQGS